MQQLSDHSKKVTIPLHILVLLTIPYFDANYLWATLAGWVLFSGYGICVGQHRYFSHKNFKLSDPMEKVLGWIACLGAQGSPLFWSAVHRGLHHRYSDKEQDLHSPVSQGIFNSYIGWQLFLDPRKVPMSAVKDMLRDPYHKWLHKNYYKIFWGSIMLVAVLNPMIALFGMILPMVWSIHQENAINVLCHLPGVGYRNFELDDSSNNVWFLGFFGWGHGYHNNHHQKPNSYNYGGERWYEFDPARILVWSIKEDD